MTRQFEMTTKDWLAVIAGPCLKINTFIYTGPVKEGYITNQRSLPRDIDSTTERCFALVTWKYTGPPYVYGHQHASEFRQRDFAL